MVCFSVAVAMATLDERVSALLANRDKRQLPALTPPADPAAGAVGPWGDAFQTILKPALWVAGGAALAVMAARHVARVRSVAWMHPENPKYVACTCAMPVQRLPLTLVACVHHGWTVGADCVFSNPMFGCCVVVLFV